MHKIKKDAQNKLVKKKELPVHTHTHTHTINLLFLLTLSSSPRKYGFETYMLDCLEGPPAILSFLCQNYGLHNIPIGTGGNYDDVPSNISIFYLGERQTERESVNESEKESIQKRAGTNKREQERV